MARKYLLLLSFEHVFRSLALGFSRDKVFLVSKSLCYGVEYSQSEEHLNRPPTPILVNISTYSMLEKISMPSEQFTEHYL